MGRNARLKRQRRRARQRLPKPAGPLQFPRGDLDWEASRAFADKFADEAREYAGIPLPVSGFTMRVDPSYRFAPVLSLPSGEQIEDPRHRGRECSERDVRPVRIRNEWYCRQRQSRVVLYQYEGEGVKLLLEPTSPDRSMDRMTFWLMTLGASDAWDEAAEAKAQTKLRELLSDRQWRHYFLMGCFLETSPRSRVLYVLRRGRPTLALVPMDRTQPDAEDQSLRCLAVLCLHPIAYYERTWAGGMTPTDDLVAMLLWMRGDEPGLWKRANQHEPSAPEAGI